MSSAWMTLLLVALVSAASEEAAETADQDLSLESPVFKVAPAAVPGPKSSNPFLGLGNNWNPFSSGSGGVQSKDDVTGLGGVVDLVSGIFSVFAPPPRVHPKNNPKESSEVDSSSSDADFVPDVGRFFKKMFRAIGGGGGRSRGSKRNKGRNETTTGAPEADFTITEESSAPTDLDGVTPTS